MGLLSSSSRFGSEEERGWSVASWWHIAARDVYVGGHRDRGTEVGQERSPVLVMCCDEGFDEAMAWAPGG